MERGEREGANASWGEGTRREGRIANVAQREAGPEQPERDRAKWFVGLSGVNEKGDP